MPPIYVKPENALKRSEELLALNTPQSEQQAFENLWEVFQSKRFKHTNVNILEPIMLKFIDLCVAATRKSHARLGLMTFKNAVQSTAVQSIETVLNHFIAAAEGKLTAAVAQAHKEVEALPESPVVDDELPLQPSAMVLDSFIDSAGDRERIERRLIAPAQKFCWDAYDICLDIAKGNDRLEVIYQSIAHRAFNFCKVHQRKSDFRRLCEQRLRKDLTNATRYGHQQHAVNLSDPETLSRHLDTRFLQLETAVELELWQEAFRTIEDVHSLVSGKKTAKASMMANYYEKLTQIFKAEGGKQTAVFHAAAWANYLHHAERAGTVPSKAPGCVVLSALAIPLGAIESKPRLVSLLNLDDMPTRQELLRDAAGRHLKRVPAEIRQLYHILEVDFKPLKAAKQIAPLIAALSEEYQPYLPALKEVVFARLLQGLSKVYDSISLSHILAIVKPFDGTSWATDMTSLEKFLMGASRRGDVKARVDHVAKSITFATEVVDANKLSNLAIHLYNVVRYINPTPVASRAEAFAAAIEAAEEERKAVAHRRQIVSKRRELMDEANARREREQSTAKAEQAKKAAEENARRQRDAAIAAEKDRLHKEMETTRREEAQKLAQTLAAKGDLKVDITGIQDLDSAKLVAMQVEQLAKEKKELNERLRIVAKRVDHLERAFRKEERPLLAEDYERQKVQDRETHDKLNAQARQEAIQQQKDARALKDRLSRMLPDYLVARQAVESQQEQEFQAAREAAGKKIESEKAKFKAQVVARRKEERERRERERAEQEEEERAEQARAEEEERLAREREEAEERARAESEAKAAEAARVAAEKKAEREAERAKLDEIARKQREREEEAERRRAERASGGGAIRRPPGAVSSSTPSAAAPTIAPPVAGVKPGGWREKEAARKLAESAGGSPAAASPPPVSRSPAPTPSAANGNAEAGEGAPDRGGNVYRRGQGMRGGASGRGAPPSARGGAATGGSRW